MNGYICFILILSSGLPDLNSVYFLPTNSPEKAQLFLRANVAVYICFPFFYAQKVIMHYKFDI